MLGNFFVWCFGIIFIITEVKLLYYIYKVKILLLLIIN
jgi:hypothetical protein